MKTVAVLDYGMSNLRSVVRALEHVQGDWRVLVTHDADAIHKADKIVFPGQGAIGNCMQLLSDTGLADLIRAGLEHKPFFGICLGLQTLFTHSDESGGVQGFDWFQGEVKHFETPLLDSDGNILKIPHMGWNTVAQNDHPLWQGIPDNSRFYFVHSYYAKAADERVVVGKTPYPSDFCAAVARDNVFAVQFHPEKSQHAGLRLLENFIKF